MVGETQLEVSFDNRFRNGKFVTALVVAFCLAVASGLAFLTISWDSITYLATGNSVENDTVYIAGDRVFDGLARVMMIFFALCFLFIALLGCRRIAHNGPIIKINMDGLWVSHRTPRGPIPWNQIDGFKKEPGKPGISARPFLRILTRPEAKVSGFLCIKPPLILADGTTDKSLEEIAACLSKYTNQIGA